MSKKNKSKILSKVALAAMIPLSMLGGVFLTQNQATLAEEVLSSYSKQIDLTNNSFKSISGTYSTDEGNGFSGWTTAYKDSASMGMIIDVNRDFGKHQNDVYYLNANPNRLGGIDDKILMLNSKTEKSDITPAKRGYKSEEKKLETNSYYKFSVDVKTTFDGDQNVSKAFASMYLNGLVDDDGNAVEYAYEKVSTPAEGWNTYNMYVATGETEQTVTLDLYLGSETEPSYGAVFFDEVYIERFSQNAFIDECITKGYNYTDSDATAAVGTSKFMIDKLITSSSINMDGYNFDFEDVIADGSNGLSDSWTMENRTANGHARVFNINKIQAPYFKEQTGYSFVGSDYSYNLFDKSVNTQALALYTKDTSAPAPGKVAVKSNDIPIKAHGIYKITMHVKVSEMTNGAFYINLIENDTIHNTYEYTKDNITLQTAASSGITSNSTDEFINKYNVVTFFVKGHELYDSSINIELALGNASTDAQGCVLVDNINITNAKHSDFNSADNKLQLKSFTAETTFKNGNFNATENSEAKFEYPLTAGSWELTQPEVKNANVVAGIMYLHNDAQYKAEYDKYAWHKSFPGSPVVGSTAPNNVFMFNNEVKSYQSIKSTSYKLEANKYYQLSFDYFTLSSDRYSPAQLTIEVVDDNGITLFKKGGLDSDGKWENNEPVQFHTASSTSHNVFVIIHFGESEKDKQMVGTAYLDNFEISDSTEEAFKAADINKVDLTDYMLNLDPNGTIGNQLSTSPAYSFSVDDSGQGTTSSPAGDGGILSGKENEYGVTNEDTNILALTSRYSSTISLKSNYKLSLTGGNYYKLTFNLKTRLVFDEAAIKEDEDHECKSGVKIGLTNFDLIEELVANDEEKWTTHTIYFNASSEQTSALQFSLVTDCVNVKGSAFLANINFTDSTEDEYKSAKDNDNFEKTVWTSKVSESTDTPEEKPEEKPAIGANFNWILIPSLIFALSIIVALVGWSLRKIKIKKTEKIKAETYDRKISLDKDIIKNQAKQELEIEVNKLLDVRANLENEKELLEQEHKELIKDTRASNKGVSRFTEKEFKAYAHKIARIGEKIRIVDEQIEQTKSHEYLLSLEKRISGEETQRQKEELKVLAQKEKILASEAKKHNTPNSSKNDEE